MGRPSSTLNSRSDRIMQQRLSDDENIDETLTTTIVGPSGFEKRRIVMLYGVVDEHTVANSIVQMLDLAHNSPAPITLFISSHGGSVDELRSLYDVMKFLPVEVQTVGVGKICSAATLLLAAGAKGKRLISASTRVMMHPVSIMGAGLEGNIFQVENQVDEMMRTHRMLTNMYVRETNASIDRIEEIMKLGHDYWMNAQQAVELGLADKIIGSL